MAPTFWRHLKEVIKLVMRLMRYGNEGAADCVTQPPA